MLIKVALVFLIAMIVIGWIGSLLGRPLFRLPWQRGPRLAARCPACGRPRIGRTACPCGREP
ncbi:hypothetical protein ruthe_02133 [Rubellimicrobium thermophilum DSM 16684]|uniref:Uncharacterized protein n=1 Tax=Rubellimicrobium thermophilum DSM 16684 TaxID=1123069 RepID=S9SE38_9RHOB|nr:hypothetical protein ruthe_02133 [Rubellimicrobium thermophilum DSM 16684]